MAERITEVKRHLDGRVQEWACEALRITPAVAVVRFVLPEPIADIPAGSETFGFFWARRNYNLYRILTPEGDLIAHRLDIVDEVQITDDRIEYLDLLLDVRISPTGDVTVEDEDEVEDATNRGLLDAGRLDAMQHALRTILRDHRRILRDALAELDRARTS